MTEILLFHHAQGLTTGVRAFADDLRAAGHDVHTPDLDDGNTFDDLDAGIGYAKQVGFDTLLERGRHAADGLANELVYAGISLGVMPAQLLAQTRRGARGALLLSAAIPAAEFGDGWPQGVPLQIHMMEDDPWVEEDLPAARELVEGADRAELFLYPGDRHLFADSSLPDYDEAAARSLRERALAFLETAGEALRLSHARDQDVEPFHADRVAVAMLLEDRGHRLVELLPSVLVERAPEHVRGPVARPE